MVRPSEDTPNGGTHVLAVCAPLGQLNYFVALALQQHGEQYALRKGRGHNVVSFCFPCPKDGKFSQGFRSTRAAGSQRRDLTNQRKLGLYSSCARCNNCVWALPKRSAPQPEKQSKKNGDALISGQVKKLCPQRIATDLVQL